jgi:hypothetical protein
MKKRETFIVREIFQMHSNDAFLKKIILMKKKKTFPNYKIDHSQSENSCC